MRRGPIRKRQPKATFPPRIMRSGVLSGISPGFPELSRSCGQVAHVLLTRPPLGFKEQAPKTPPDLHVLGTPPAFVLSQDQTLRKKFDRAQSLTGLSFALQFSRNAFFFFGAAAFRSDGLHSITRFVSCQHFFGWKKPCRFLSRPPLISERQCIVYSASAE